MFAAEHNVVRADRIMARLESRADSLGGMPLQGRPVQGDVRRLSLPHIQLVLDYRIVEDENAVRILRVWHTRENREEP